MVQEESVGGSCGRAVETDEVTEGIVAWSMSGLFGIRLCVHAGMKVLASFSFDLNLPICYMLTVHRGNKTSCKYFKSNRFQKMVFEPSR